MSDFTVLFPQFRNNLLNFIDFPPKDKLHVLYWDEENERFHEVDLRCQGFIGQDFVENTGLFNVWDRLNLYFQFQIEGCKFIKEDDGSGWYNASMFSNNNLVFVDFLTAKEILEWPEHIREKYLEYMGQILDDYEYEILDAYDPNPEMCTITVFDISEQVTWNSITNADLFSDTVDFIFYELKKKHGQIWIDFNNNLVNEDGIIVGSIKFQPYKFGKILVNYKSDLTDFLGRDTLALRVNI